MMENKDAKFRKIDLIKVQIFINPLFIFHRFLNNLFLQKTKKKIRPKSQISFCMVRVEGLEPPSREALDPKSSVSTNFTTPALMIAKIYKQF